jgi:hypothetical protein
VAVAVSPVDPPVDPPADSGSGDETVDPPADSGSGDETVDPPADPGSGDETVDQPADPGSGDATPESDSTLEAVLTQSAPTAVAPKAAAPAAKTVAPAAKTANVGYNVQTAVGRTSDSGIPTWLLALTGVFTAGAALVLWQGGRRARNAEG